MQVNAFRWVPRSSRKIEVWGLGPALTRRSSAPSHRVLSGQGTSFEQSGRWFGTFTRSVLVVAVLMLCACRSQQEREVSREIAAMAHLINQLREAPHNAKTQPLRAASELGCKAAPACELQQVCVQAYRLHADAVQLGVVASRAEDNPTLIRDVLERAERDLTLAKEGMARCVALQGELTREYKL
jgi:hypothetical protein